MADQATSIATKAWVLPAEIQQIRLDAFVRRCLPHLSRRAVESAIRERLFSVGDKVSKKGDRLSGGDKLVFRGPALLLAAQPQPEAEIEVRIVYEDAALLIVNKPAGVPTHGFSARDGATLANFLLAHFPEVINVGTSRWEPGLVHRLDRETSGLIAAAKTQAAFESLKLQFRRRQVKKIYWALVWGIAPPAGLIEMPLAHDTRDTRRMCVIVGSEQTNKKAWKAVTRYRRIGESRGLSLLEIDMETGVTHQIRAHLAGIGHAIVADTLYGEQKSESFGLKRHFLHARSLTFFHPGDGRPFTVKAELPEDLTALLKRLRIKI
jgi:23S rRNA pseudouridine1911/1915/1917 synthase